ncbi:MAG: hydantoinase B/oxoprolinase family protein, partial [Chloroflexi bacterium]|nr:hydantoinase B/oxoprolinase family protein [Chloroflexota bacterium]
MASYTSLDPATFAVLTSSFFRIADEMGINLLQSARSTIIREARDASCALLDASGQIIAEAEHIPVQLSSLSLPLKACLRKHADRPIRPGEVFVTNDPFDGGQHMQDITIFSPIFWGDELVAFAGSIAHHVDIGGSSAGLTYDAKESYQEGVLLPSLKVDLERDFQPKGMLHDLIRVNFRAPDVTIGDLRAQLAASHTGEVRLKKLIERYGLDVVRTAMRDSLDYSERLMRQAIEAVPDGTYEGVDQIDDGVFTPRPIKVAVAVTVKGSDAYVDFTGTDPQVPEFLNAPYGSTLSTTFSCIKMALGGEQTPIPANEGCNRPIHVFAPYGSLVNPAFPAAVRARMCPAYRIFDALLSALQKAVPGRIVAQGFHVNTTSGFSRFADGRYSIFIEDIGGGWGAGPRGDGADMIDEPLSNCKITPIEAIEFDHPFLMMERYELIPGSGGPGRH